VSAVVTRVRLQDIAACFEGIIPSMLCTCSLDGIPNVTYLSIVHRLDDEHVALSVQFFNKTRRNVLENPRACIVVVDPQTMDDYRLDVGFDHTESEGPVFQLVRSRLEATASQGGVKDVFRLRGVDVYRVLDCQPRLAGPRTNDVRRHGDPMEQLSRYANGVIACKDLETLMTVALENLDRIFGHGHSFVMVRDEAGSGLYTLLSHGFEASGVGSEVRIGEGLIGAAAERREPVRSTNLSRDRVFSRAVRQSLSRSGQGHPLQREIPLPGLANANSQLVVPLIAHDELVGVLCLQSETPGRFLAADERLIQIVGHHLAASMVMLGFTAGGVTASAVPAAPPGSGRIAPTGSATVKVLPI
jgi:GAF domain/Pyridoxamine 5'-phosphate oxidase